MADDAEATFRERLIVFSSNRNEATECAAGSRIQSGRFGWRLPRRFVLSIFLVPFIVAASWWSETPGDSVGLSRDKTAAVQQTGGTPVALASDLLDGLPEGIASEPDPLDGPSSELVEPDDGAPDDLDELPIVRSGRSPSAPDSSVAYDGDRSTAWPAGELDHRWVWFDLGAQVKIRELRWLATGSGKLAIEVSDDREEWREVGTLTVDDTWNGLNLREDTQYVRLTFLDSASDDASLLEIAAYGLPPSGGTGGGRSVELAQERKQRASDRKDRRENDRGERRKQRATDDETTVDGVDNGQTSDSGVTVSTKPGKTKCKGDKARCRADKGTTRVEEDCATDGTCVIDVRADGGTAICDSSGGDNNETGQGEGKQPVRGGRCEATADGGTVTIGDINP